MKLIAVPLAITSILLVHASALAQNPPREYIESTSPLQGGGVVTTIQYSQPATGNSNSVLNTVTSTGSTVHPGSTVRQNPNYVYGQPAIPTSYQQQQLVQVTPQMQPVPALGVPTDWRTAMRANCNSCDVANTRPSLATQGLAYSVPQTLPQAYTAPQVGVYRPLIPLRNMPPNAYAGQGIIGQPKLYVDGQPVRNFFRYIFP